VQGIPGITDILSWQDPQLCLKTVPLLDIKHLDIVDFVSLPIFIILKTVYNPGMAMNVITNKLNRNIARAR
jgi:hypothetical protein